MRRRLILLNIIMFLMSVATMVQANALNKFQYVYLETGDPITIDQGSGAIFFGDFGVEATFCSKQSGFYCVQSEGFHFAVPKNIGSKRRSWKVKGHDYELISAPRKVTYFGANLTLYTISAKDRLSDGLHKTKYYYAPTLGLLGFEFEGPSQTNAKIVLSSRIGFGASKD
jgi:hypothetical protein